MLRVSIEVLARGMIDEATQTHGVSVIKVHPALGEGMVSGQRQRVGVVKDDTDELAGTRACNVSPVLVGEAFRKSEVEVKGFMGKISSSFSS